MKTWLLPVPFFSAFVIFGGCGQTLQKQTAPLNTSVRETPPSKLYTFAEKCDLFGVLHCEGFDSQSQLTYDWPTITYSDSEFWAGTVCDQILGTSGLNYRNYHTVDPQVTPHANTEATVVGGQCVWPKIDTSIKHSGAGSIKFDVVNHSVAPAGEFYGVFRDYGDGTFGYVGPVPSTLVHPAAHHEGNELWLQFYSWVDSVMLSTAFQRAYINSEWQTASAGATSVHMLPSASGGSCRENTGFLNSMASANGLRSFIGQKIMFQYGDNFIPTTSFTITGITADGCGVVLDSSPTPSAAGGAYPHMAQGAVSTPSYADGWKQLGIFGDPGPGQHTCCGPALQASVNNLQMGVPTMYSYDIGTQTYFNPDVQNRRGCVFNGYPDPTSAKYREPPCIRYHPNQWQEITIHINVAAGTYNDTACPSTTTGQFQMWIDGQLAQDHKDFRLCWGPGSQPNGANGLGQFNFSPYHTGKDPNQSHPNTAVRFDDFIISTKPIPMLSATGGGSSPE